MTYEAIDDFLLKHYGILGQKWGVRRFQNEDGSLTPAGKRRREKIRNPKKLTDEELAKRTQRQNLENNYIRSKKNAYELNRQLYKAKHPRLSAAISTVNKVIIGSGTVAASAFATQYAQEGFRELGSRLKGFR